jgi:hypothetical protein
MQTESRRRIGGLATAETNRKNQIIYDKIKSCIRDAQETNRGKYWTDKQGNDRNQLKETQEERQTNSLRD